LQHSITRHHAHPTGIDCRLFCTERHGKQSPTDAVGPSIRPRLRLRRILLFSHLIGNRRFRDTCVFDALWHQGDCLNLTSWEANQPSKARGRLWPDPLPFSGYV
jgi:hypothetical protein